MFLIFDEVKLRQTLAEWLMGNNGMLALAEFVIFTKALGYRSKKGSLRPDIFMDEIEFGRMPNKDFFRECVEFYAIETVLRQETSPRLWLPKPGFYVLSDEGLNLNAYASVFAEGTSVVRVEVCGKTADEANSLFGQIKRGEIEPVETATDPNETLWQIDRGQFLVMP